MNKSKRNRIPISCSNCRKRKAKCDKKRPFCTLCKLRGMSDSCTYHLNAPDNTKDRDVDLIKDEEISRLQEKVKELELTVFKQSQMIESQDLESKGSHSRGLESISSGYSSEKYSSRSNDFIEPNYIILEGKLLSVDPVSYFSFFHDESANSIFEPYRNMQRVTYDELAECTTFEDSKCSSSGLAEEEALGEEMEILNDLPRIQVIKALIKIFSHTCLSLAPFLDMANLTKSFNAILHEGKKKTEISVNPIKHKSTLAILLIVLRFAFIASSIGEKDGQSKLSGKLSISISPKYIDCASKLLISTEAFKRVNLRYIQALLLLRVYKSICPEDDDTWIDMSLLQSLIMSAARIHGLSRESRFYPTDIIGVRVIHTWKVVWLYACYFDICFACDNGLQPSVTESDILNLVTDDHSDDIYGEHYANMKKVMTSLIPFVNYLTTRYVLRKKDLVDGIEILSSIINKENSFAQISILMKNDQAAKNYFLVRDFLFRLDVYSKLYLFNYLLFLNMENRLDVGIQEKSVYLTACLEVVLVIMYMTYNHCNDAAVIFGESLCNLVTSRILITARIMIPSLNTFLIKGFKRHFSLTECMSKFVLEDSSCLKNWLLSAEVLDDDKLFYGIICKMEKIFWTCEKLNKTYYSSFKLYLFLSKTLRHFDKMYTEKMSDSPTNGDFKIYPAKEECSLPIAELTEYWTNVQSLGVFPEEEQFLSEEGFFNSQGMLELPWIE